MYVGMWIPEILDTYVCGSGGDLVELQPLFLQVDSDFPDQT